MAIALCHAHMKYYIGKQNISATQNRIPSTLSSTFLFEKRYTCTESNGCLDRSRIVQASVACYKYSGCQLTTNDLHWYCPLPPPPWNTSQWSCFVAYFILCVGTRAHLFGRFRHEDSKLGQFSGIGKGLWFVNMGSKLSVPRKLVPVDKGKPEFSLSTDFSQVEYPAAEVSAWCVLSTFTMCRMPWSNHTTGDGWVAKCESSNAWRIIPQSFICTMSYRCPPKCT